MDLIEAEQYLKQVTAEFEAAVTRRDGVAYQQLYQKVLDAQRTAQFIKGEEFAEPLESSRWQPSFPNPLLVYDCFDVWLICPIASSSRPLLCRATRFESVHAYRMTEIGDELGGVALNGRGLEKCKALEVINSEWLKQIRSGVSSVKAEELRHFAFCFKDSLFEIVAKRVIWLNEERTARGWFSEIESVSVFLKAVTEVDQ